jgi:glutathione S-transferase
MRELYHYPLDAYGRIARVYLNEKSLEYQEVEECPWDRKKVFSEKHVVSDLPAFIENDGTVLEGCYSIVEYVEQTYRSRSLLGDSFKSKAEVRRISALFNVNFFADVTNNIVFEKVMKKYMDRSSPDSASIRKGNGNIKKYLDYISWLSNRRNWLAGDNFSLADISAAAHISCLDYLGSIEWESYPEVKGWYVRIKSRPSFRGVLKDRIINVTPPDFYSDLDF